MGKYLIKFSESFDKKLCETKKLLFGKELKEEEEKEEPEYSENSSNRIISNEEGNQNCAKLFKKINNNNNNNERINKRKSFSPFKSRLFNSTSIITVIIIAMTMGIDMNSASPTPPPPPAATPTPTPLPPHRQSSPSLVNDNDYAMSNHRKETIDSEELDKIRESIMMDLGLTSIPDPSKANVSQTEYEKAHRDYLNRVQLSAGQDQRTRRKLDVYYPADPIFGANTTLDFTSHSIYFPIELNKFDNHAVDHSTFRLLVETNDDHNDLIEVSVYQPTRLSRRLIARRSISVSSSEPRWLEFDSTEATASWIHEGEENLGLDVEIRGENGDAVRWSKNGPSALNLFTISDLRPDRGRRSIPEELMSLHRGRKTECKNGNKKCCRHQMTVIFKDLKGFEFIIQPKDFDAGYCKGRCPPRYNPAHHHALLQSLIWKEDRKKAPRPCCAPSKLTELEILYFDEKDPGKLKVSNWKNMKVLECACS